MRKINVDLKKPTGKKPGHINYCVGAGRAYELLGAESQRQLREAVDRCGFKYLRFHGIFHDEMGICKRRTDGKLQYSYNYLDLMLDAMLDIGIKPFFELGFMPEVLASGPETIFFWKGNITPPKCYDEWADLVTNFVTHLIHRYGIEQVREWPFEIWNEPNLIYFWYSQKPFEDYMKLYEASVKAIKAIDENLLVGGPSTAGIGWINEFIEDAETKNLPVDFITTHGYNCANFESGKGEHLDEFGRTHTKMTQDEASLAYAFNDLREQVEGSKKPGLPIHITEWGTSYSARDASHDHFFCASFIVNSLKITEKTMDSMSYWTFSDIFEEAGASHASFVGCFGLQNPEGVKKPAFFAYEFLNKLGEDLVSCDDEKTYASKTETGAAVMFWSVKTPDTPLSNQDYFTKDIAPDFAHDAELTITGLTNGRYKLIMTGVGYKMNDAYTMYKNMDFKYTLSREQVQMLKKEASGKPFLEKEIEIKAGTFTFTQPVRENDVFLCELEFIG